MNQEINAKFNVTPFVIKLCQIDAHLITLNKVLLNENFGAGLKRYHLPV